MRAIYRERIRSDLLVFRRFDQPGDVLAEVAVPALQEERRRALFRLEEQPLHLAEVKRLVVALLRDLRLAHEARFADAEELLREVEEAHAADLRIERRVRHVVPDLRAVGLRPRRTE